MSILFYKLIGAALIAASAIKLSSNYKAAISEALRYAEDAERFVRYVGDAVHYRLEEIGDIISSYKDEHPEFSDIYGKYLTASVSDTLSAGLVPYDAATLSIMKKFASELGRSNRESQTELCLYTSKKLRDHIKNLSEEIAGKSKTVSAVTVFAASSLIILFI